MILPTFALFAGDYGSLTIVPAEEAHDFRRHMDEIGSPVEFEGEFREAVSLVTYLAIQKEKETEQEHAQIKTVA